MATVLPVSGQSNYDLCLKAYGSLDRIVYFCRENSISDINIVEKKIYKYEESRISNKNITGYDYKSGVK